jgi:hypothetical protein
MHNVYLLELYKLFRIVLISYSSRKFSMIDQPRKEIVGCVYVRISADWLMS